MNGKQIENLLELIDSNIDLTRDEAYEYIRDHEKEVALSLRRTGTATIKTKAGDLRLSLADLQAAAA